MIARMLVYVPILKISNPQSAQALLDAAENSLHPTVQHLAAKAYQAHPRRTRDVSHIVHATGHHR